MARRYSEAGVPALPPHARSAVAGVLGEQLVVEALHAHVGRLERLQAGQVGQAAQLWAGVPMREGILCDKSSWKRLVTDDEPSPVRAAVPPPSLSH